MEAGASKQSEAGIYLGISNKLLVQLKGATCTNGFLIRVVAEELNPKRNLDPSVLVKILSSIAGHPTVEIQLAREAAKTKAKAFANRKALMKPK